MMRLADRLRGRSWRELASRSVQAARMVGERVGAYAGRVEARSGAFHRGAFEDALDVSQAPAGRIFPAWHRLEETGKSLRSRWPEACTATLEAAEAILAGRVDLLGYRDLDYGQPVDWHLDPITRQRTPLIHWSRIPLLDPDLQVDPKRIWELNRHSCLVTLARAYVLTPDERFARSYVDLVEQWIDANPPQRGINWASSLEVALRAIAWTWALHLVRHSPHVGGSFLGRALESLYLHGRHIEAHLSEYFSPNTHLTGEALGLYYLGSLWPGFRRAARWRATGRRILERELFRQVHPDGVYFEQSTFYHRYTLDFYLHFMTIAEGIGEPIDAPHRDRIAALAGHWATVLRPDGFAPPMGDDDGGQLIQLQHTSVRDGRPPLSTAAVLLKDPELAWFAGHPSEETLWLLGEEGLDRFEGLERRPPSSMSAAFPKGGYYVMRDDPGPAANHMVVKCGPHGGLSGGHDHADALSFEATVEGRPAVVDSGTHSYREVRGRRNRFRHTAAHNTVLVDGHASAEPSGAFGWHRTARAWAREWVSTGRFDYLDGEHDGYHSLSDPVRVRRSILFLKGDYWIIRDRIEGAREHSVEVRFHLPPGLSAARTGDGYDVRPEMAGRGPRVRLLCAGGAPEPPRPAPISDLYGRTEDGVLGRFLARGQAAHDVVTVVLPEGSALGAAHLHVGEDERAIALRGRYEDRLFLSPTIPLESSEGGTDAELAWLRCDPRSREILEYVLLDGREIRFQDRVIARAHQRLRYQHARIDENGVQLDGDPPVYVIVDFNGRGPSKIMAGREMEESVGSEGRGRG